MDPALAAFLALLGGIALGAAAMRHFDAKRAMRRNVDATPISRIGDVRESTVVRVVGKVVGVVGEPLAAPVNAKACAYWRFEIREGDSGPTGRTRFSARDARDFWLEDASGRVLVHAGSGATWVVVQDVHGRSGTFDDPTPEEQALFRRYGVEPRDGFVAVNKYLTYEQQSVDVGELVTVLGLARREAGAAGGDSAYRERETRLVIGGDGKTPFVVSDEPQLLVDRPGRAA